jgi:hypothetical protein
MDESKCWTCMRGNARPDPDGCPYHRLGKLCFDKWRIETKDNGRGGTVDVLVVTECKLYDKVTGQKRHKRLRKGR